MSVIHFVRKITVNANEISFTTEKAQLTFMLMQDSQEGNP